MSVLSCVLECVKEGECKKSQDIYLDEDTVS
jgi:hypothetical protein